MRLSGLFSVSVTNEISRVGVQGVPRSAGGGWVAYSARTRETSSVLDALRRKTRAAIRPGGTPQYLSAGGHRGRSSAQLGRAHTHTHHRHVHRDEVVSIARPI